jgi:protease-4
VKDALKIRAMGREQAGWWLGVPRQLVALLVFVIGVLAALVPTTVAAEDGSKQIASITLSGPLPDGVGQDGLLGDVAPRLHRLTTRLKQAATDEHVGGVLLTIRSPDVGRGRAAELRAAISVVRAAGKPVVAHLITGEPVDYSLATACDTILMPPAATLATTGVRTEVTFFKGLLDRLGVQAEILQVGEFKGAGEPLTRETMSPQLRQQYEAFVGDLYDQMVAEIATDRNLSVERVAELIDRGVFTPEDARQAGLIDGIAYEDEALSVLSERLGKGTAPVKRDYGKQEVDTDFSGLTGLMKLVEVLAGSPGAGSRGQRKRIAIIHVLGEIVEGKGSVGMLGGEAAGAETIIKAIRQASEDETVAALVVRIDSPGGSALASDLIWRELDRCEKPVVASLSDTAASGGYYIAVAADKIVAAAGTLTGSIGVVGGKIAVGGALDRFGVHTDVVSRGKNAGWLSAQQPFSEHEREAFLSTMKDVYRLFTSKVAQGRQLDREHLETLAEGRVFTGRMAQEEGLVDMLGTLDDAVNEAARLADLSASDAVERLLLPEPRGLFDAFFGVGIKGAEPPLAAQISQRLLEPFGLDFVVSQQVVKQFRTHVQRLELISSGCPLLLLPVDVRVR